MGPWLAGFLKRILETAALDDVNLDLRRLELAQAQREFHNTALWKAQLHFGWVIAATATAVGSVGATQAFEPVPRLWVMVTGCGFGLICSLSAVKVLRLEGVYLHRTALVFSRLHDRTLTESPDEMIRYNAPRANKPIFSLFLLRSNGIRHTLQLLFLITAVGFGVAGAMIVAAGPSLG